MDRKRRRILRRHISRDEPELSPAKPGDPKLPTRSHFQKVIQLSEHRSFHACWLEIACCPSAGSCNRCTQSARSQNYYQFHSRDNRDETTWCSYSPAERVVVQGPLTTLPKVRYENGLWAVSWRFPFTVASGPDVRIVMQHRFFDPSHPPGRHFAGHSSAQAHCATPLASAQPHRTSEAVTPRPVKYWTFLK